MWKLPLKIEYIDGSEHFLDASEWSNYPGEGVNIIEYPKIQHAGDSIYYLRKDVLTVNDKLEDVWVAGCFSLTNMGTCWESAMFENGHVIGGNRRDLPDLHHSEIKLGWWRKPDAAN